MAKRYKVTADGVGPWAKGQVISDDDLKANPQFGGDERLRDQLNSIEDTTEKAEDVNEPARFRATGAGAEDDGGNSGESPDKAQLAERRARAEANEQPLNDDSAGDAGGTARGSRRGK